MALLWGIERPTPKQDTLTGVYLRAVAWMQSVRKLDNPADLQATAAAARALLELSVDMALVGFGPDADAVNRMADWEKSAKFLAVAETLKYWEETGLESEDPERVGTFREFVRVEEQSVKELRVRRWGGVHPPRWTGHNLEKDSKDADEVLPNTCEVSLRQFYCEEIRWLHFQVHGSAMTLLREAEAAQVLRVSARSLGMIVQLDPVLVRLATEGAGVRLRQASWKQVHGSCLESMRRWEVRGVD